MIFDRALIYSSYAPYSMGFRTVLGLPCRSYEQKPELPGLGNPLLLCSLWQPCLVAVEEFCLSHHHRDLYEIIQFLNFGTSLTATKSQDAPS